MTKRLWIAVALAVVVLAAFAAYSLLTPAKHLLTGTRDAGGELQHIETAQYYQIKLFYPERTPLYHWWDPRADTRARLAIESWLKDDSAQFVVDIAPDQISGPEKESLDSSGRKYQYSATYKQFASQNGATISYEYDVYVDTGGAHPNGYFQTFTFDQSGSQLSLADLFAPDADYLTRLASSSLPQILSQMSDRLGSPATADDLFMDGLSPTPDNFSNWVIDSNDLVLLFPPYQVASYAAGTFEVRIPLEQLAPVLKSKWR